MPENSQSERNSRRDEERLDRPWVELGEIVRSSQWDRLYEFLAALPAGERARAVSRLSDDEQIQLLTALPPEQAAGLIEEVSEAQAVELIELLPPADAAAIINNVESDKQADLLAEFRKRDADAILAEMDPAEAADARRLARYDPDTAGGLMITEYLCYRDDQTVRDVIDDLRANAEQYADYDVQYAYAVQGDAADANTGSPGVLRGVLRLRDLLLSPGDRPIAQLMIHDPLAVRAGAGLEELEAFFDHYHFFGAPVVDAAQRLVGVIRRHDVEEAIAGRAGRDYLKVLGIVGGDELRTMPLSVRTGRRLVWLAANVLLNLLAVSVIGFYEDTIAAVVSLAIFLPLISDMGGNAGVQAIAVSIRELTLGLIKPHELMWVMLKEASVGILCGIALGLLVGVAGYVWQRNAYLGLIVGVAMMLNTLVATVAGGVMPMVLKRLKMDPSLAAGPLLTTITDMTGFFFVLSLATAVLPKLTG